MKDLLVLCYHAVSPTWPAVLSVTPAAFERQLETLVRLGYRGATFSDALSAPPGERVVCVTFDDGYRSVLELAKPILDRYGYPGTLFVPTDWPGNERPMCWQGIDGWLGSTHEVELAALSWPELRALAGAGWEIGSHTCSHPHLTEIPPEQLSHELVDSKARVEAELSAPCSSLAYPYGDVNGLVTDAAREAGYLWAATIPRVLSPASPLLWPRAAIYHEDGTRRFRAKISPSLRRLRASQLGNWLDRARTSEPVPR